MSCKLQNIFLWFLKISWIARMSKITFLNFGNYWYVLEASKYFSIIFNSLLDCQYVQVNFTEVWQFLISHISFKIFFYDFLKVSGTVRMFMITLLKFGKSWNVSQTSKYLSIIIKSLHDCQNVQDMFLMFDKSWNVLKYFSHGLSWVSDIFPP